MKGIKALLWVLILLMFFIGSNHLYGDAQWTFMVYLDADNNLEPNGIDDFLEMAAVGSDTNVNIVVMFDRISGYDTSYGDWTTTKYFHISPGLTPTAANAVSDLGEANMGDPNTLVNFVSWAKTNYPATNYALILWNHGGGWRSEDLMFNNNQKKRDAFRAVCWDDTNGGDCLYMSEVKTALATQNVQLLGFDACLMGMTEVAYNIKDYATVMVGSEETEPVDGWPYNLILGDLKSVPTCTPIQLAKDIVHRYYESYGDNQTQSAIDLTRMSTLAGVISTFAQSMMDNWDTNTNLVKAAAQGVMDELDNTILLDKHGSGWPGARGLAMYFPKTSGTFDSDYDTTIDFSTDTQWNEFLADFYSSMGGSWIEERRTVSQEFYYPEHIDLYHFCELIMSNIIDPYIEELITNEWVGSGTASGFQDDDGYFTHTLPFDFPFCGEVIPSGSTIYISSNGYIDFDSGSDHADFDATLSKLYGNKRIAPIWTDMKTDGSAQAGEDVYITENPDHLIIRWVSETFTAASPVNVEVKMYTNGTIQFNYNGTNNNLYELYDSPVIGVSKGTSNDFHTCAYSGSSSLDNPDSVVLTPISNTDDLLGSWAGQGVWYRNSDTGSYVQLYSVDADMVVAGDLDNDGTDDLIGSWPAYAGLWIKYSSTGTWEKIGPVGLLDLCVGDMNGDGRDDVVGNFTTGVWYRDTVTATWQQLYTVSSDTLTVGDLDNDGLDDLIGSWPQYAGLWVRYSDDGSWEKIGPVGINDLSCGDMNGDGLVDPVGSFNTGIWYRDAITGLWNLLYSVQANQIVAADINGDGTDDILGLWTFSPGTWVRYSTGTWEKIGATAEYIDQGRFK